jgi:hypothetical protein
MFSSTLFFRQPIIDWNILRLGITLAQLDNDGWEFVVAYVN